MTQTITELLSIVFWFIFFWFWAGVIRVMIETKQQAKEEILAKLDTITHRVKIEKHDEIYYWYDEDDDEFLGQGRDYEIIISVVKKRFPKHVFFLQDKDSSIYKLHGPDWQLSKIEFSKNG